MTESFNRNLAALRKGLKVVAPLVAPGTTVPRMGTSDQDLGVIATGLLRKAFIQASAVAIIAKSALPEGGIPNARSMLEALGELHYLAHASDRLHEAQIAFAYALYELRDFTRKWGDTDDIKTIENEVDEKEKAAPNAYSEARRRNNYWIPIGRAQLVEDAFRWLLRSTDQAESDAGRAVYKLLSWDEHHVMAALLSVEVNPAKPEFGQVKRQDAPDAPEEYVAMLAVGTLASMLKLYTDIFFETVEGVAGV